MYILLLFCYYKFTEVWISKAGGKVKVAVIIDLYKRYMPRRQMEEWMYRSTYSCLGTSWRWVVSFTPWERAPGTHWIGGWVGPRTGVDEMERRKILPLLGLALQPLGHPARSQSLYWLHSPGSQLANVARIRVSLVNINVIHTKV
jgi:hypothetical protein